MFINDSKPSNNYVLNINYNKNKYAFLYIYTI